MVRATKAILFLLLALLASGCGNRLVKLGTTPATIGTKSSIYDELTSLPRLPAGPAFLLPEDLRQVWLQTGNFTADAILQGWGIGLWPPGFAGPKNSPRPKPSRMGILACCDYPLSN